jgi:YbgC/YbaW family acyl-CoA thioester hydrolase
MGEVKLQTYWVDSDPAGIVYFAHFFRFVEQAEEELYLQKGVRRQDLLDKYSIWMPRVEAHVNFVRPIRNGEAIRVRMNPQFQRLKTVRFEFEVVDDASLSCLATGYMTVVCVDREKFKSTVIPQEIRDVLEGEIPNWTK